MRILVVNGPNLNLLGTREPEIYGSGSLEDLETGLRKAFPNVTFSFVQSNHEGALIEAIQAARVDGVVLNGAGYTHTSVALRDAIHACPAPVIEVHISNIAGRERFRRRSITAGACVGSISGLGRSGYHLAVRYFLEHAGS